MYEELVKRLRNLPPEAFTFEIMGAMQEAADAIEELSREYESVAASLNESVELVRKLQSPRWISVTERLPEKNQIVVAHEGKGTWDFGMFRGISPSGNPEYWHWKKNTFKHVKWWMPKDGALPEPPKEES